MATASDWTYRLDSSNADGSDPVLMMERITLREFAAVNDLGREEIAELDGLAPGESVRFGGGAAPIFTLTRLES